MARRAKAADGNGADDAPKRGPGRPRKEPVDSSNFTSDELKKFEALWATQKRSSQEQNQRLSDTVKAAIDKGADRRAIRMYTQLLAMDAAKAWAVLDQLRFFMDVGRHSDQKDFVRDMADTARRTASSAGSREEMATEPAI